MGAISNSENMLELTSLRVRLSGLVGDVELRLVKYVEGMSGSYDRVREVFTEYRDSQYVPWRVSGHLEACGEKRGDNIYFNAEQLLRALSVVHRALSVAQELSTDLRTGVYHEMMSVYNVSKSLYESVNTEVGNDLALVSAVKTMAQRERETAYVLRGLKSSFDKISSFYYLSKDLVFWLGEQLDYLKMLDSRLKLTSQLVREGNFDGSTNVLDDILKNGV